MIDGLKPYPKYKNSGVPWLGEVPEHWEVARFKRLFREIDDRSTTGTETLLSLRMEHGLVDHHESGGKTIEAARLVGYKKTEPGDVVMNRMRAASGLFAATSKLGIVSPDYAVLRPRTPLDPDYFVRLFRTPNMMTVFRRESRGLGTGESGFLRLYTDTFGEITGVSPPLVEQLSISQFLTFFDNQISRYIRAKKKLIALLDEQKQAILYHAVTRGLDANVRLSSSGEEWWGDVPEHWAVVRNKAVCRLGTGHTPSRLIPAYWINCTVPWFTLNDVHQIRGDRVTHVYETRERISELGLANSSAVRLPRGTVILSRTASVGFSAILGRDMATSQDFMAWTPGPKVIPEYLLFVLRAMRPEFRRLMHGSTHQTIYMPTLHSFRMPLPPLNEQQAIANYINSLMPRFNAATEVIEREMKILREFRARLISDAVTGNFDVRDEATGLPKEADADEFPEMGDTEGEIIDESEAQMEEAEVEE